MSKREKIIVVLMLLAILYGAANYLYTGTDKSGEVTPEKRKESLNKLVTDVAQNITENSMFKLDNYIVQQASIPWENSPFYVPPKTDAVEISAEEIQATAEKQARDANLSYSGYLQIGATALAIINGTEYEVGDTLDTPGYTLKQISPQQVVLGVDGQLQDLVLPREEVRYGSSEGSEGTP